MMELMESDSEDSRETVRPITYSIDCIEENLYIGNLQAAIDSDLLENKKITHLITVDVWPIPMDNSVLPNVEMMRIPVFDLPNGDLLSHFENAFEFIESVDEEGSALVHCHEGVSRSAAVVLSYLMKKYEISFEEALEMTISKKNCVQPNPSFVAQLKLYETMGYQIDISNMQYRMFRLYLAADKMSTEKILAPEFEDVIKLDPALPIEEPDPRVYRCKKCRRVLATESNIIPHFPSEKHTWRDERYSLCDGSNKYCQRLYFIEPLTWMKDISFTLGGKLYCPNRRCQLKLGSYCWATGCLCPCGAKVCPGFYLVPSKVDKVTLVLDIEKPFE